MSATPVPPTHTVVVSRADGRPYARFTSHDAGESRRYVNALKAANPDLAATVESVEQPEVPDGLRPFIETEAA